MDLQSAHPENVLSVSCRLIVRYLPPELTLDEFTEYVAGYHPYIRSLHFISGKAPSFYPSLDLLGAPSSTAGDGSTNTVKTTRGNFVFSSKRSTSDTTSQESLPIMTPEEMVRTRLALERHYVSLLGGECASAFICLDNSERAAAFFGDFADKIFESSRGHLYQAKVAYLQDNVPAPEVITPSDWELWSSLDVAFKKTDYYAACTAALSDIQVKKAGLTIEQQMDLMLKQDMELHPWKHDTSFMQKTPLLSFLAKKPKLPSQAKPLQSKKGSKPPVKSSLPPAAPSDTVQKKKVLIRARPPKKLFAAEDSTVKQSPSNADMAPSSSTTFPVRPIVASTPKTSARVTPTSKPLPVSLTASKLTAQAVPIAESSQSTVVPKPVEAKPKSKKKYYPKKKPATNS